MKQFLRFPIALMGIFLFFACEQPSDNSNDSGTSLDSKTLKSIEIASPPDKTLYKPNETFDSTGLVVKGTYSDNTGRNLAAAEYKIGSVDTSSEGTKPVMITAGTLNADFDIDVDSRTLKSTAMSGTPKAEYNLWDNFSFSGIEVIRTFEDNSTKKVKNKSIAVIGYDKGKRGLQPIQLKADGRVVGAFAITVTILAGAKIKINKYKSVYVKGESFDAEGAGIEATVTTSTGSYPLTWENGGIILTDKLENYNPNTTGVQTPKLVIGNASTPLDVFYVVDMAPEVYFDYGYMRHTGDPNGTKPAGIDSGLGKYYVKAGETLMLAPVRFLIGYGKDHKDKGAIYSWSVSGGNYDTAVPAIEEYFSFKPTEAGKTYTVTVNVTGNDYVTNTSTTKTASTEIVSYYNGTVDAGGKTFPRAAPPTSPYDPSPAPQNTLKNFAPGQFTEQGNGLGWSLGAWGGYQIWTVKHQAEYDIRGNGFGGWEEPGIVWVMEDNNGNGLPDEMWYELKGGDDTGTNRNLITRRYGLTYFSPDLSGSGRKDRRIYWLDSKGRGGMMFGGFSAKWGVTGDWVTFTGTILRDDGNIDSADNPSKLGGFSDYVDIAFNPAFKISNARRADGSSITLSNVKFIKVQSGMFRYGDSTLGEVSTEVHSADGLGINGARGPNTTFPLP